MIKKLLLFLSLFSFVFANCEGIGLSFAVKSSAPGATYTVSLKDILDAVSTQCDFTIILKSKAKAKIESIQVPDLKFEDALLEEIFDTLLSDNNLFYSFKNGFLTIEYVKTVNIRVNYIDATRSGTSTASMSLGGEGGGTGSSSISSTEKFDFWGEIEKNVKAIVKRPGDDEFGSSVAAETSIIVNKKSSIITLSGTKEQTERVRDYIEMTLETLRRQAVIEIKIINVELDNGYATGIDWSRFDLSMGLKSTLENVAFKSNLFKNNGSKQGALTIAPSGQFDAQGLYKFLRTYGPAKSLSNPKVLAINNQPVLFSVGENINYQTKKVVSGSDSTSEGTEAKSIFVGVLLDVTAQIAEDNFITLRINPTVSSLKANSVISSDSVRQLPPDTTSRRLSSVVRVKSGDTIILGGLIRKNKKIIVKKVPGLANIPYLGKIFQSKSVTDTLDELVFVLTPKIINQDRLPSLEDLGFRKALDSNTDIEEKIKAMKKQDGYENIVE